MLNSRKIEDLRADVAANCRIFIEECKKAGYPVLVTGTVRDDEYQQKCYHDGTAATPVPSFHGMRAGLAFDICKKVKGQEYSDNAFWRGVAKIGKDIGFTWGGDWKSFPDKPHFQWDDHGRYTNAMVRAGQYPPQMEEYMTQDKFNEMMGVYRSTLGKKPASSWAKASIEEMKRKKTKKGVAVTDGTRPGDLVTREEVIVMLDRLADSL